MGHLQTYGAHQQPATRRSPLALIGGVIALFSAIASMLMTLPTWYTYKSFSLPGDPGRTHRYNGWEQMAVNIDHGRTYGWLMLVSFVAVGLAILLILSALLGGLLSGGGWAKAIMLVGVVLGLAGGLGLVLGYLALGVTNAMSWATWGYGLAWIPALVGAILFASARR